MVAKQASSESPGLPDNKLFPGQVLKQDEMPQPVVFKRRFTKNLDDDKSLKFD